MSTDADCLFCKIVAGDVPADIVREDEHTLAFRDIAPQAPTHVLGSRLLVAAGEVARAEQLDDYRLVFNTGAQAGQTVFHTHLHVLGGRSFQWPPG